MMIPGSEKVESEPDICSGIRLPEDTCLPSIARRLKELPELSLQWIWTKKHDASIKREGSNSTMRLPDLKSEDEERTLWEKQTIADYWEDLAESDDTFRRPKMTPITLKFDPLLLRKIKMLANKRGISYSAYIRYLLSKSVEREIVPASMQK